MQNLGQNFFWITQIELILLQISSTLRCRLQNSIIRFSYRGIAVYVNTIKTWSFMYWNFEGDFLTILIFKLHLYTPPSIFELETWNFTESFFIPIANNPRKPIFEFRKNTPLVSISIKFLPRKNRFLALFWL